MCASVVTGQGNYYMHGFGFTTQSSLQALSIGHYRAECLIPESNVSICRAVSILACVHLFVIDMRRQDMAPGFSLILFDVSRKAASNRMILSVLA